MIELLLLAAKKTALVVTYATWNPSDKNANITLSGGNLIATAANNAWKSVRANMGKSSGKRYWEVKPKKASGGWNAMIGVGDSGASLSIYVGNNAASNSYYSYNGKIDGANRFNNNVNLTYGNAYALNDVIGIALDMDGGTVEFFKNNVTQGVITGVSGTMYPMVSPYDQNLFFETNFGATALTYTPPSGFNAGLFT